MGLATWAKKVNKVRGKIGKFFGGNDKEDRREAAAKAAGDKYDRGQEHRDERGRFASD